MTPEEMGLVFNQLVARRAIYSFATPGRRRSQEEKDSVEILERQYGRSNDLEEFLRTQGLKLQTIDAFALGLANTGRIYVAVRDPVERAPEHLATNILLQELIDERRSETAEASAIWATFFLLVLLYFLYTTEDRPIEAISAFKDSAVDVEQFLEEVRHRIEQLRIQSPHAVDSSQRRIHDALTNLSEAAIESRVKAFFNSMLGLGVLEPIPSIEGYRQTLWSAVDVATNFQRHAGSLALAGLDGIAMVAVSETEATPDQTEG